MTYGWALILVATVVGILVFIIGFQGEVECASSGFFSCAGEPMQGEDLILTLQNNSPFDIIINPYTGIRFDGRTGYAKINYQGKTYRFEDEEARIGKGTRFDVTGIGMGSATNLSITYTDTSSGLTRDWTTPIKPTQQETCNNGTDDDGDNLIDCADPECKENEPCTYVEQNLIGSPSMTIAAGNNQEYTFQPTLPSDQWSNFQITSVQLFFLIEGTAPSASDKPTITLVTTGVDMTMGDPKTGANSTERLSIAVPIQNIEFKIINNSGSPMTIKAPVAEIKVKEKPEGMPG